MDKTKWYSIDYKRLAELESDAQAVLESSTGQIGTIVVPICPLEEDKMSQAIPEITTETSTKTTTKITTSKPIPFSDIITYLNNKKNSSYKPETKKTKEFMIAR
ncbi:hypothetical protein JMM81_07100 [Bacillus sp. V3B]|uniref:hypothetical protein n=1 Tax=Bacillus sp. V3B TaxID=2804915 RepID=UPI002108BCDF|nr:hypothetical protein [Bacillus sp. V3B]MCQ6274736.1 hypothetical protein [Bacillus sp. V3B]